MDRTGANDVDAAKLLAEDFDMSRGGRRHSHMQGFSRLGWVRRCAVVAVVTFLVVVTAGVTVDQTQRAAARDSFADDFETSIWNPGRAVLDGRSPVREYTAEGHDGGSVYPPAATLATLPFSVLPYRTGLVLWLLTLSAAVVGGLWLCGVRDWRCYLAAAASPPVIAGLLYANVSLLFVLALALIWRWRDRPRLGAPLLGLVIAAKLFLWPLVVWLALTRRWSTFAFSAVFAGLVSVVAWAAVGFEGIVDYPGMIRRHAEAQGQDGLSVAALAAPLGEAASPALGVAAGLVALAVAASRRRDDLGSFAWSVAAALFASPMVWTHYYALLLVPLALATPAWGILWLAPFLTLPQVLDAATGVALTIFVAFWATTRESDYGTTSSPATLARPRLRRIVPARRSDTSPC